MDLNGSWMQVITKLCLRADPFENTYNPSLQTGEKKNCHGRGQT